MSESHSESEDEYTSSASSNEATLNLQTGGDVSTDDQRDSGPDTSLACASQQETHLAICSGDFGKVVKLMANRSLSDGEKFALLKHSFVPSSSYTFPTHKISGRQWSFQHSWLGKYNGLCYSVTEVIASFVCCLLSAVLQLSS